jgi:hypothetical protein
MNIGSMNRTKALRATVMALSLLAASGCDRGLTEVNRNPNAPEFATVEQLFPSGVVSSITRTFGSSLHMSLTALWAQHYAQHRYTDRDVYNLSDGTIDTHWTNFYVGPQQDFQEVITKGEKAGQANVVAMATVMQSWTYHVMTDLWGDIGYSEALKGRDPDSRDLPALDPQQQVYNGIFAALKTSEARFDPGQPALGSADLIYKSDIAKWRKLTNSLRLRVAMRLSEVDETLARTEFNDALAAGIFTSNADNAVLKYINDETNVHPIYDYQRGRDDHSISATMVDTLKSLNDPRLPVYANLNGLGESQGMRNGLMHDPPLDSISRIGTYFSKADANAVLLGYAEVLFLQAEAAERGWTTDDPAALYSQAITVSMQELGIGQAAIDAYLAQPEVAYAGLPSIGLQKWIALFGNGVEAYAEWRRTGFPNLQAGPSALNGGLIPVRLPYPQSESSRNGVNLSAAIARQGGASLNDRLWWNK